MNRRERMERLSAKYGVPIRLEGQRTYVVNGHRSCTTLKAAELAAKEEADKMRAKNPRMQNIFMIVATKGKVVLKYVRGMRFSSKGRAVLYPSRHDADVVARELRANFPVLRGYKVRVLS